MTPQARQQTDRQLERLGELLLAAGRKIGAAIQAQSDPRTLAKLAEGLDEVATSYRQTCALRLKLDRQTALDAHDGAERLWQPLEANLDALLKRLGLSPEPSPRSGGGGRPPTKPHAPWT